MMCSTFKYITLGPTKGILKLFVQNFIMHRNGPGTSCATFYGDKRPGRSDWSADMGPFACANAGRRLCASDALEDQGLALRLTDLWQAQGGSQRGRPTRPWASWKLTEKMVRFAFGRRAPGLTFGTTMTTSSVPVALRAASRKVLAAVPKYRQSTGKRLTWHWKQLWQWSQGSAAWRRWSAMPPTRQSLVPQPMSSDGAVRRSRAPPKSHEVGGSVSGYAAHDLFTAVVKIFAS